MCTNCNQNNCNGCTQEVTICNQCTSEVATCDCEIVDFKSDCIIYNADDIECNSVVVVAKNTILSDALNNIVSWSCTKFSELANYLRIVNVGTGASIYAGDNLIGEKKLRKLKSTNGSVTITQGTDDIDFSVVGNLTYSASNIGTGANVYKDTTVVGSNTQFNIRKIKSSDNSVTITEGTDAIDVTFANVEGKKEYIVIPLSDLITNLTTGITKAYFRMPFAATIDLVSASVLEAQTAGSILTFDINENGTSILSTKLTIDNNEKTSITATTPPVISDASFTYNSEITFDIDQVGTAGAKGAMITLSLTRV